MATLTVTELIDLADRFTQDLLCLAHDQRIAPRDLVMAISMTQKLLQEVLYEGDTETVQLAMQKADATYKAINEVLGPN